MSIEKLAKTIDGAMTREAELLLACARTAIDDRLTARIAELARGGIDWLAFVDIARQHHVTPLVYRSLSAICSAAVPADALDLLRAEYHASARQSLALAGELLRLLSLFEGERIRAIALKGPALAAMAYGNLSLRQFGDLDILVRREDILRAKRLLLEQGYQPDLTMTEREERLYLQTHYVYEFTRTDGAVYVELHYHERPKYFAFEFGFDELLARLYPVAVAAGKVASLSPEDTLLFLCAHGSNHCWERLAWVCDIAELLRRQPLDWDVAQRRGRELGGERMLLLGLLLARRLLGAEIPPPLARRLERDRALDALARQVIPQLFQSPQESPGLFWGAWFHLRARERWRDRLRYCLGVASITTAEDWALFPLPASLSFVYSLVRPFRLLGTYGIRPLKRLHARQTTSTG